MRIRLPMVLLGVTVAAAAAGCTETSTGDPKPGSSTSRTSESAGDNLPSNGAPKVEDPVDADEYEQDPCKALTSQQAQELNVANSERDEEHETFGPACRWNSPESDGSLAITFFTKDSEGLSSVYKQNDNGDFAFFEEVSDIEGYPAVAYDTKDSKPATICAVSVGLSDQLAFDARVHLSTENIGKKDPCDTAAMVAGLVMKNLTKGE